MEFIFHKERKEDVHEESINVSENEEVVKERIKNRLQDYEKPVPCTEDTICEDSGVNEETNKTNLNFKEEIKGICEEHITVHEEKYQEEYPKCGGKGRGEVEHNREEA
ncbi:unnamed protein product [Amaranthus hypochondriacus]